MNLIHPQTIVKAAALLVLAALPARALLTEPDKVYFGTMTVNGRAVTQTDTQYVVRVNRGAPAGPEVESYRMGADTNYHRFFYGLRLTLEALTPVTTSQVQYAQGLYLSLYSNGTFIAVLTNTVTERAQLRMDFGPAADSDQDAVLDLDEYDTHHTDPFNPDTDGDGLNDGRELLAVRSNPLTNDTDGDLVFDASELSSQTDPLDSNSFPAAISGLLGYAGVQTGTLWVSANRSTNAGNRTLLLDGNGDYLALTGLVYSTIGQVTALTAEAWIKTTSAVPGVVIGFGSNAAWQVAVGHSNAAGRVAFTTVDAGGLRHVSVGYTPVNDGLWHHIAATFDAATGAKRLFIDGFSDAAHTNAHAPGAGLFGANSIASRAGFIGVDSQAAAVDGAHGAAYFNGMLDEVRLWQTALARGAIASGMYATASGAETGLLSALSFDDGTATDATPNQISGLLRGNALIQSNQVGYVRRASIPVPGAYALTNVPTLQAYAVLAYRDSNGNRTQDHWEARGAYPLNLLALAGNTSNINITLDDPDSDGDLLPDYQELFVYNTDPFDTDTDNDGLTDGAEVLTHGTDPNLVDSDGDGLGDGAEVNTHGTQPDDWDTDDDGFGDGWEIRAGTNPLLAASFPPENPPNDFDGDGRSDYTVVHQSAARWFVEESLSGLMTTQQWGWATTAEQPGDFDGDGQADLATFDQATGNWYIRQSSNNQMVQRNWGWNATEPIPADFDGDGITDLAVYHTATGDWYVRQSSNGQMVQRNWGWSATRPVAGDFDGDGRDDLAVFYPTTGTWYIRQSSNGNLLQLNWGWAAVIPVPADYDGDRITDLAVFDPATAIWYIRQSTTSTLRQQQFGWAGVLPVRGDYDGDGKADLAVYHRPTGQWYVLRSTAGIFNRYYGWSEATPVTQPPHPNP